jgi:tRNA-specific 2-thiouridylase
MSGGVDSSVAAALLVERGFEAIGIMLRLWTEPGEGAENRCCTPEAVQDARRVARVLGIPFYLLNCERRFKAHVVDPFIREYASGRTPNPCLACNRQIKFGYLLEMALALDADHIATGHYARVQESGGEYRLLRGIDAGKDQSYVLYMLGQEQLRHTLFPIGEHSKREVREMAARWHLPVAGKEDSQDICFVRDHDYRRFLQVYAPEAVRPGPILDRAGHEIGRHQGLPFYTTGQRRGLGIAWPEPLYVLEMDTDRNALIVAPSSELGGHSFRVTGTSFVGGQPPPTPTAVTVRIRYTGREVAATLYEADGEAMDVRLAEPVRDITPGQAAVFYRGEVVLGGGIIDKHEMADSALELDGPPGEDS